MTIARRTSLLSVGVSFAVLVCILLVLAFGSIALVVPLAAVAAVGLIARPRLAVGIVVSATLLCESQPDWGPSSLPSDLYSVILGAKVTPIELLIVIAIVAVLVDTANERRSLALPRPFIAPLLLMAVGLLAGAITGRDAGAGLSTIINAARTTLPLLVVPLLVVQVVRTQEDLRRALALAGGIAVVKALAGLAILATGMTPVSDGSVTYYSAPANILMMGFLLFVLGAWMRRMTLPPWVLVALPFVFAALLLSYRRSFWIATAFGLLIVAIVAVGHTGRRTLVPIAALVAVAVAVALSTPGGGQLAAAGPPGGGDLTLGSRLASLSPSAVTSNREDRYRIDERRNVLAQLLSSPIAGIGLGVAYTQRYPLPIGDITREYVHFGLLWWWMKLGLIGLIAYPWLIGAGVVAGVRVWRLHPSPLTRVGGLAGAATVAALAVTELTATFVGADLRSSIVVGALFGLLAVGWEQSVDTGERTPVLI